MYAIEWKPGPREYIEADVLDRAARWLPLGDDMHDWLLLEYRDDEHGAQLMALDLQLCWRRVAAWRGRQVRVREVTQCEPMTSGRKD